MSASDPVPSLNLEVRCADSATEVFVIDGEFNLRDRGIGVLKTALEPGIYKVKVRAGFETQEQSVVLRDQDQVVEIPRFSFVSPAPLSETSRTHEFHIQAAYDESRKVHVTAGQGSSIFIFARDWTGDTPPAQMQSAYANPAEGLSLHDRNGKLIADFSVQGNRSNSWEPWAACNVALTPDCYLLNLLTPEGDVVEQTIVASPGWQTQVFLLQKSLNDQPEQKRADVHNAAILMARLGQGFDPDNNSQRLAELARLGLANGRRVLSDDVRRMLDGKFQNPMLGILAAHLLLMDPQPDMQLFSIVVNNLRSLLDLPHPDVEALGLKLTISAGRRFEMPPMLRKSWNLIVEATAGGLDLVPEGSLAEKIATQVWGSDPWLIWTKEKATLVDRIMALTQNLESSAQRSHLESFDLFKKGVLGFEQLEKKTVMRSIRKSVTSPFAAIAKMKSTGDLKLPKKKVMRSGSRFSKPTMADAVKPVVDKIDIGSLSRSFNIPRRNLERMIDKFDRQRKSFSDE